MGTQHLTFVCSHTTVHWGQPYLWSWSCHCWRKIRNLKEGMIKGVESTKEHRKSLLVASRRNLTQTNLAGRKYLLSHLMRVWGWSQTSPETSWTLPSPPPSLRVSSPSSSPFLHVSLSLDCLSRLSSVLPPRVRHPSENAKEKCQAAPAPGLCWLNFLSLKEVESLLSQYTIQKQNKKVDVEDGLQHFKGS